MFSPSTRTTFAIAAIVVALVGVGTYVLWPRTPDSQLTPGTTTTTTTTTTAAAVTTTTTAAAVADEKADTGSAAATTPPDAETTTTTTTPPDAETTTATTTPPDAETTTATTATTLAAVGEPPTFRVITPTHLWPENPNAGVLGAARQSLFAWERIRGFWAWYLTEGHAQAHGFDAASRPELSATAAEQVNWVHHRFWSEVLPTWDRVWNDEFAKERERQREWIMTAFGKKVYNAPGDGYDPRYWGPRGHSWVDGDPGGYYPAMLPLVDLDGVAAWMATRGLDLDAVAQRYYEADAADARAEGFDIFPYISEWSDTGFGAETLARALAADVYDEEARTLLRRSPVADALDPNLDIWKEWAASVDLEAMLGPQAAGGKMGPSSGEMWYQWHPEGMDVSTVNPDYKLNGEVFIQLASVFQWFPNWWPERLEVPVHDPAQASIGGTIAPRNPDTGNFYFEVCLWASGGLFGPWSLPHPELPDASANTTWWITGLADPAGTILEISLPRNRPCLSNPARWFFEREWAGMWDQLSSHAAGSPALAKVGRDGSDVTAPDTRDQAYVDMLARVGLGSWLWRENPNPDSGHHQWLGWKRPRDYTEAPETLGIMIHPLYQWNPDGDPVGFPAGDITYPWKWWPVVPARDVPERTPSWRVAIGGCHQPGEPYMWLQSHDTGSSGITADGGPVWAWPGVVEGSGMMKITNKWRREAWDAFEAEHGNVGESTPMLDGPPPLNGSEYYPPVPCQDILDGKYEPDWTDYRVTIDRYQRWMPAVGDRPPPDWTDPHDPFK